MNGRRAHALVRQLRSRYRDLSETEAVQAVVRAYQAVAAFGLTGDDEADALWSRCAERDVRLRLGIDREEARLDPEAHPNRSTVGAPAANE